MKKDESENLDDSRQCRFLRLRFAFGEFLMRFGAFEGAAICAKVGGETGSTASTDPPRRISRHI